MTRRRGTAQAGMTLIELMVSLIVVSIAVAFIFRIYATSSAAYRGQARVSELQQTLRTAKDQLMKDLRMAGHLAQSIQTAVTGNPAFVLSPVSVVNDAYGEGPDRFRIVYADHSCEAHVQTSGPPFNAAVTTVDDTDCFVDGDVAMAVRTGPPQTGEGCILKITQVVPGGPKLQHNPGAPGAPWNEPGNNQCDNISGPWQDGRTMFVKFIARAYRIKPDDPRGVLQMDPTGALGAAENWQDLAYGFVDLQIALRIYDPAGVDVDGDGDPLRNWFSGENLEAADLLLNGRKALQARLTLVARTTAEISGVLTEQIAAINGTPANNNAFGDRPAVILRNTDGTPTGLVTDKTSRYYGDHIYRTQSTLVDFRNMGIGL